MATGGLAMVKLGGHAVVLGAGIGGLLAARVLADFYDTVTVVERDVLPERSANRHGVPQGRHVHLLLGRGSNVLGELFPGFLDELVAAGTPVLGGDNYLPKLFLSNRGHQFPAQVESTASSFSCLADHFWRVTSGDGCERLRTS
jgi:2-polyprenyl-6-methoxyphenol hydroxylase-like FAD-dependent oxidoreductase